MEMTAGHAKDFAREPTRRAARETDRLSMALSGAAVDLDPHQVAAAFFPLQSLRAKGMLLADQRPPCIELT